MKCYFCGAENEEGAVFCEECGKKIDKIPAQPEPSPKPEPIMRTDPSSVPHPQTVAVQSVAADNDNKKRNIIIAVLAASVVILTVIIIVMLASSSKPQDISASDHSDTYAKENVSDVSNKATDNSKSPEEYSSIKSDTPAVVSAPQNIAVASGTTAFEAYWDAVAGASAYRIYSYEPELDDYVACQDITDSSFYVYGLDPNTTYYFKIATLTGTAGNYTEQAVSEPVSVTTQSSSSSGSGMCWACSGSGLCRTCEGKGVAAYYIGSGDSKYPPACSACSGTGLCPHCGGTGYVS